MGRGRSRGGRGDGERGSRMLLEMLVAGGVIWYSICGVACGVQLGHEGGEEGEG